jgi:hypothetical protein
MLGTSTRQMREEAMDHRAEQDERWAKLTLLGCPTCGMQVLVIDLPVNPFVWCGSCVSTPRLEKSAT